MPAVSFALRTDRLAGQTPLQTGLQSAAATLKGAADLQRQRESHDDQRALAAERIASMRQKGEADRQLLQQGADRHALLMEEGRNKLDAFLEDRAQQKAFEEESHKFAGFLADLEEQRAKGGLGPAMDTDEEFTALARFAQTLPTDQAGAVLQVYQQTRDEQQFADNHRLTSSAITDALDQGWLAPDGATMLVDGAPGEDPQEQDAGQVVADRLFALAEKDPIAAWEQLTEIKQKRQEKAVRQDVRQSAIAFVHDSVLGGEEGLKTLQAENGPLAAQLRSMLSSYATHSDVGQPIEDWVDAAEEWKKDMIATRWGIDRRKDPMDEWRGQFQGLLGKALTLVTQAPDPEAAFDRWVTRIKRAVPPPTNASSTVGPGNTSADGQVGADNDPMIGMPKEQFNRALQGIEENRTDGELAEMGLDWKSLSNEQKVQLGQARMDAIDKDIAALEAKLKKAKSREKKDDKPSMDIHETQMQQMRISGRNLSGQGRSSDKIAEQIGRLQSQRERLQSGLAQIQG